MSDHRDEAGGFKVTDRRRFAGSDDPSSDAPSTGDTTAKGEVHPAGLETVTFATFVVGLSTQALMHLGEIGEPAGGEPAPDLVAAQHLIDILAVLEAKTTGNLTAEESGLLEAVLYDLRMRYVAIAKRPASDPRKEPT
jgi:hypothetical protein